MTSWSNISTLIVELANGKRCFTEKKLLSRYCNYFSRLFEDGSYYIDTNTIALWDVSYEEFKVTLQILQRIDDGNYSTKDVINVNNVLESLSLASRFESPTLLQYCTSFIKQNIREMDKFKCLEYALQTRCEDLKIVLEQHFSESVDQEETATTKSFLTKNKLRISQLSLQAQSFILKVVMDADGRKSIRLKFERSQKEGLDKKVADLRKSLEQKNKELEETKMSINSKELDQLRDDVKLLKDNMMILKGTLASKEKDFAAKIEEEKTYRNELQERVIGLLDENVFLQEKQKDTENLLFQLEFEQSLNGKSNKMSLKLNKIWDPSLNATEIDLLLFDEEPVIESNESETNENGLIDLDEVQLPTLMYEEDVQLFDFASFYPPFTKEATEVNNNLFRNPFDVLNI